ncbi:hypothetical protein BJ122_10598 [Rhodopseudomonas faecalis]|uniref:Uncharacterized protein n=1 Tax=Rhodopseudomonas faecalis TaxID=99655 RepID=A0A318TFY6_9BRAD|nr:hypothetical protein [Rhodopseudomonas faecalis]PYF03841.1 hypothetical protein BJ122_10598 [Rhodopseudomonas faecalis]
MTTTAEIRSIADDMQDDALTIKDLAHAICSLASQIDNDDCAAIDRIASLIQDRAIEIEGKREKIWQGLAAAD